MQRTAVKLWVSAVAVALAMGVYCLGQTAEPEAVRPTFIVYVTEKPQLKKTRPNLGESIVQAELQAAGFRVLSSLHVANLEEMMPRDVRGVWNTDRRMTFRKHFNADMLWMASVEYELGPPERGAPVSGTMTGVARVFSADADVSVWYGAPARVALEGATLESAARGALAKVLPAMVANFIRSPNVRSWLPTEPPQPWPAGIPRITSDPGRTRPGGGGAPVLGTDGEASGTLGDGYTGIVVHAEHLRIRPSFRTELYSQQGRPLLEGDSRRIVTPPKPDEALAKAGAKAGSPAPPERRMMWADSVSAARQQTGRHPLHLKALSSEGNRIVLPETEARRLQQERQLLDRGRVTVVVRPPDR